MPVDPKIAAVLSASNDFRKAQRHLSRRDPVLKQLISLVGPCTLTHEPDRFVSLVRSIISQQISTKAAASIRTKLENLFRPGGLRPRRILSASDEKLRSAGLSAAKVRALRDLSEKVHKKVVALDSLHELTDEDVISCLLPVRGIGRWTAEMFLIFSLGRLDVLPVADLGFRAGVRRQYALEELPNKDVLEELARPWRPYRSVATWYIWRSLGVVPQSSVKSSRELTAKE
jgi:DNA-3-methyladenine glycosylase II